MIRSRHTSALPGGHVESGDVIYDMIKFIQPVVKVVGTGWVASAATTIYLAAEKENRFSLPNTRFLVHQPLGGARGDATDIAIQAEQIVKMRARINKLIANETGQPLDRVAQDTDRDYWMTVEEAVEYGIVGKVISSVSEISCSSLMRAWPATFLKIAWRPCDSAHTTMNSG